MEHFDTPHTHHILTIEETEDLVSEVAAATLDGLVALARVATQPRAWASLRPCSFCAAAEHGSTGT